MFVRGLCGAVRLLARVQNFSRIAVQELPSHEGGFVESVQRAIITGQEEEFSSSRPQAIGEGREDAPSYNEKLSLVERFLRPQFYDRAADSSYHARLQHIPPADGGFGEVPF